MTHCSPLLGLAVILARRTERRPGRRSPGAGSVERAHITSAMSWPSARWPGCARPRARHSSCPPPRRAPRCGRSATRHHVPLLRVHRAAPKSSTRRCTVQNTPRGSTVYPGRTSTHRGQRTLSTRSDCSSARVSAMKPSCPSSTPTLNVIRARQILPRQPCSRERAGEAEAVEQPEGKGHHPGMVVSRLCSPPARACRDVHHTQRLNECRFSARRRADGRR